MSKAIFEDTELINLAYCDSNGNARISNILAIAQLISEKHCISLDMDYNYFVNKGKAFLLAKLSLDISRLPKGNEKITLRTHAYLPNRAIYNRCTDFIDTQGNVIIKLDSRWTLVDIATHRICRGLPEDIVFPFDEPMKQEDFRCLRPTEKTFLHNLKVLPHMLDVNCHVNNTVYADIVFDAVYNILPITSTPKRFEIYYHNEAKLNDEISVYYQKIDNVLYISGEVNEKKCFETVIKY